MNPLDECYDPRHPTTREDTYNWRAKAFEYMRSLGMAVSSEEPADCFIPDLDFVHWNACPQDRNESSNYLGIPVPLHTLVYHDALLTSMVNAFTSVLSGFVVFSTLGHIAFLQGKSIKEITNPGPGLIFVTYPQAISMMPGAPLWAIIFFFMVLLLFI